MRCPRSSRPRASQWNIDKISILDARGLHGDGASESGAAGGQGNLADAAVAAAMRYRVGRPLIDGLMAELGMAGGSLNGMLAGSDGAVSIPRGTPRTPSRVKPLNGGGSASSDTSD